MTKIFEMIMQFIAFFMMFSAISIVTLGILRLIWNNLIIKLLSLFNPNLKKLIVEDSPFEDLYNPYMPYVYGAVAIFTAFIVYSIHFH